MLDLAQLNEWLQTQSHLILPAVGFTAFIESLAIAGIIVPGVAILFSIAALASLSGIPLMDVLIAAFIGAVAGDLISFFLGKAFHNSLPSKWPFSRYPDALEKGELFFQKYGTLSVVIGRFIGPLRPVLPITAGILKMPTRTFVSVNLLSAIAWAPAYILPGYVGASLSQTLFSHPLLSHALLGISLLCVVLPPCLAVFNIGKFALSTPNQRKFWCLYSLFSFSLLSFLVLRGTMDQLDVWILSFSAYLDNSFWRAFWVLVTLFGDQALLIVLFLSSVAFLCHNKLKNEATFMALSGIFVALSTHLLKFSLEIARPNLIAGSISTHSFPSGHTSGFLVFLGSLYFIIGNHHKVPTLLKAAGLSAAVLMALSRVALGVHWLSDVFAGLMLGVAVLSMNMLLLNQKRLITARPHQRPRWEVTGLTLVSLCLIYILINTEQAFHYYAIW